MNDLIREFLEDVFETKKNQRPCFDLNRPDLEILSQQLTPLYDQSVALQETNPDIQTTIESLGPLVEQVQQIVVSNFEGEDELRLLQQLKDFTDYVKKNLV